jgi:uncharacterized pyridoxamine 5'-phosphate oxidase family protein
MEEVMQFLNEAGVYYISSVGSDGKPHSRPFGSRMIFEGNFYIATGIQKAVCKQISAYPYVELVTMGKDRAWIRIAAKALPVEDIETRKRIFAGMNSPRPFLAEEQMAFALTEVTATIYEGENQRTITW